MNNDFQARSLASFTPLLLPHYPARDSNTTVYIWEHNSLRPQMWRGQKNLSLAPSKLEQWYLNGKVFFLH